MIIKAVNDGEKPSGFHNTGTVLITDHPVAGVESKDSKWGLENCWGDDHPGVRRSERTTSRQLQRRAAAPAASSLTFGRPIRRLFVYPTAGPLFALIVIVVVFSATTSTFMNPGNMSLIAQQSVVIGTLALGQTLIILVSGIDLANGAIMVLGTVVAGSFASHGDPCRRWRWVSSLVSSSPPSTAW